MKKLGLSLSLFVLFASSSFAATLNLGVASEAITLDRLGSDHSGSLCPERNRNQLYAEQYFRYADSI